MKTKIIIAIVLIAIGVISYIFLTPKIDFEHIDWLAGTVQYKISGFGKSVTGTKYLNDTTSKTVPLLAGYNAIISSEGGKIVLLIMHDKTKKIIKSMVFDFATHTYSNKLVTAD